MKMQEYVDVKSTVISVQDTVESVPKLSRKERMKRWIKRQMPWVTKVAVGALLVGGMVVGIALPIYAGVAVGMAVAAAIPGAVGVVLGILLGWMVCNMVAVIIVVIGKAVQQV